MKDLRRAKAVKLSFAKGRMYDANITAPLMAFVITLWKLNFSCG
jgi:hypothetical protein